LYRQLPKIGNEFLLSVKNSDPKLDKHFCGNGAFDTGRSRARSAAGSLHEAADHPRRARGLRLGDLDHRRADAPRDRAAFSYRAR
jgi:hypothetical protein